MPVKRWPADDVATIIDFYREHSGLWLVKSKNYSNRDYRRTRLNELVEILGNRYTGRWSFSFYFLFVLNCCISVEGDVGYFDIVTSIQSEN